MVHMYSKFMCEPSSLASMCIVSGLADLQEEKMSLRCLIRPFFLKRAQSDPLSDTDIYRVCMR